ncbi:Uncharacterised protein [Halioglobus japonicus]|nr:Uncharacterised protein [Halioglobus japonicus]
MSELHLFSKSVPVVLLTMLITACGGGGSGNSPIADPDPVDDDDKSGIEHLAGGDATVPVTKTAAFSAKSFNMSNVDRKTSFENGNHFFEQPWVQGSQSTESRDGVGPYFNSTACQNCHINDGRGHAAFATPNGVDQGNDFASMIFKVSQSTVNASDQANIDASYLANVPDSVVGGQLQHRAVDGVANEADLAVSYTEVVETFTDGYTVSLRKPTWHLISNFAPFDDGVVFSARVAPPMIGLGLLALIDEQDIYNQQDENDADGDGISGKANQVWSPSEQAVALGRFGWKAAVPTLEEQAANAFFGDMGLTSKFHTEDDCSFGQEDCLNAPNGTATLDPDQPDPYEVVDSTLALVVFYSNHLGVPRRRDAYSDQVQRGKDIFFEAGCESCHTQTYVTGEDALQPELSNQTIFPYTDLLLHDMGDALADFYEANSTVPGDVKVEFGASAREWRTPPLWGIGLTKEVDADATFLHDGRAITIMEAILWHGGEAEEAKDFVLQLSATERSDFLAFLNDL